VFGDSVTTGSVLYRRGSALTTGYVDYFYSDSADTSVRSVVKILNDNASSSYANALEVEQDSAASAILVDMDGNGSAIEIISVSTTVGSHLYFNSPVVTSANVINVSNANSFTSGRAMNISTNSSDTGARNLINIVNDNSLATGALPLFIQQDAAKEAIGLQLGTVDAGYIDFKGTADADSTSAISTLTTTGTIQGHIQIEINGVKRWIPFYGDPS
jgi:hypothetical protein